VTSDPRDFDPLDPSTVECPFPFYEALRSSDPVFRVPGHGWFLVSSYEHAVEVLMDPVRFSSSSGVGVPAGPNGQHPPDPSARVATLLTADPPVHAYYRSLVNKTFSVRRIAAMESDVRVIAEGLVDAFPPDGPVELNAAFSVPLPLIVICDMLGLPRDLYPTFKRWSDGIATLGGMTNAEERAQIEQDRREFAAYLIEQIHERRNQPREDLTSDLVHVDFTAPDGEERKLNDRELLSILPQLLVAGNETTTNLITSGIMLLAAHPEQMAAARADVSLVPNLVEEVLRVESPVQCHFRRAVNDTVLGGVEIPAGAGVGVLYGSANRDDGQFPDAATFDIHRPNARSHLAFSQGIHFCVGAPLGRLEAKVAFEVLLSRLDGIELEPGRNDLRHVPSFTHRGLRALWIRYSRRSPR
jgi:cytochrome P450